MGRTKLKAGVGKDARFDVRMTAAEKAEIFAAVPKHKRSEWARDLLLAAVRDMAPPKPQRKPKP